MTLDAACFLENFSTSGGKSDEARSKKSFKWASEMHDLSLLFVNFIVENNCLHVYVLPNVDAISFALH